MACRVYQDHGAQRAGTAIGHGQQGLLKTQLHTAYGVSRQLAGRQTFQAVDVEPVADACHFGFDPLVTMQSPIHTTSHQVLVI